MEEHPAVGGDTAWVTYMTLSKLKIIGVDSG
jgi:hypothetical protein